MTTHNAITSLAAAMANYANPTLIAHECYDDALEATSTCNQMHQSLNLLSHKQQCTLKHQTQIQKKSFSKLINMLLTKNKLMLFKHKVKKTTLMKKKIIIYYAKKRVIENNPKQKKQSNIELDLRAVKIERKYNLSDRRKSRNNINTTASPREEILILQ